ncbi:hypothetical protein A2154_01300 [Candidatus Gottesmanbacteria bacterium RBG_16_43_7]|uniref:Uncharacterized protein n=1 Tax=Candidatus Gottesmanbacteria bacterium RBG_16_43_7 TaxID=1798373 RepID=A0A1F5Z8F7_9BACT|nr:MAG: hypothetical protein A2154_01300 [Candidatus Gottesmanbacteria bacterium RBG_16_43_7]
MDLRADPKFIAYLKHWAPKGAHEREVLVQIKELIADVPEELQDDVFYIIKFKNIDPSVVLSELQDLLSLDDGMDEEGEINEADDSGDDVALQQEVGSDEIPQVEGVRPSVPGSGSVTPGRIRPTPKLRPGPPLESVQQARSAGQKFNLREFPQHLGKWLQDHLPKSNTGWVIVTAGVFALVLICGLTGYLAISLLTVPEEEISQQPVTTQAVIEATINALATSSAASSVAQGTPVPVIQAPAPEQPVPSKIDPVVEKYQEGKAWFQPGLEAAAEKGPMFRLHDNLVAYFRDPQGFDWGIFIWILLGSTIIGLVLRERLREQQPHDVRLILMGFAWFFSLRWLNVELATFILRRSTIINGIPVAWPVETVRAVIDAVALIGAIIFLLTAVLSVKRDLTPMSGGLVFLGMYLILTDPYPGQGQYVIGVILVMAGVIVHTVELGSQDARAGAVGLVVGMLPWFLILRVGLDLLLQLLTLIPEPASWAGIARSTAGWLLNAIYSNRGVIATAIGILVAYNSAERSAELIFGKALRAREQEEGTFAGRLLPTEETPAIDAVLLFLYVIVLIWLIIGNPLTPVLVLMG